MRKRKTNNWGGPRAGAGRPKRIEPKHQVTLFLLPETIAALKRVLGDENVIYFGSVIDWLASHQLDKRAYRRWWQAQKDTRAMLERREN